MSFSESMPGNSIRFRIHFRSCQHILRTTLGGNAISLAIKEADVPVSNRTLDTILAILDGLVDDPVNPYQLGN